MSVQPARFRFSLFALFVLMTIACLALAWWVQPRRYVVESLFHVSSVPQSVLSGVPFDAREFEVTLKTQKAYFFSDFVIMAALRQPGIAALPILVSKDDPVAWVRDRLEVEATPNSEILAVRLHCFEHETSDATMVLNALAGAYENEVVFEADQRARINRDALHTSYSKLSEELTEKLSALQKLGTDSSHEVERKLLQFQIDTEMELLREMNRRLETHDLEAVAPARIRLIQKAVSRPE